MEISVLEIIDGLEVYHLKLGRFYDLLKSNSHDVKTVRLLDELVKSEEYLANCVEHNRGNIRKDLMKVRITIPESNSLSRLFDYNIEKEMDHSESFYDILFVAIRNDELQRKFCAYLIDTIENPSLKSMFSVLCCSVKNEIRNLNTYRTLHAS